MVIPIPVLNYRASVPASIVTQIFGVYIGISSDRSFSPDSAEYPSDFFLKFEVCT